MTKSGALTQEKKSKIVKTCFLHELNDSESNKIFFQKKFFGSFKILKTPNPQFLENGSNDFDEI